MDLKDFIIILLIICILGTFIFGTLGSFLSHVGQFVGHVSNEAGATSDKFSVDYLEGKSPDSPSNHQQSYNYDSNNQKDYSVVDGSNESKSLSASSSSSSSESKSFESYLGISNGNSDSSGSGSGASSSIGSSFSAGFKSLGGYLGLSNNNHDSSSGSGSSKVDNTKYPLNISRNTSNISNNTLINNTDVNKTVINNTGVNHTEINKTTNYEDYQIDYVTNMFDSENNSIIRSIVSTNGGMVKPGIYEVYWSKLGVINQTRIG